jgi:hypothetical protein
MAENSWFLRCALLLLPCTVVLAPKPSFAQSADAPESGGGTDVEQARKHFSQGLKLYKDGDFDAALVQFERAYSIKSSFKVLYNIAQCYFELHQYVDARDTLTLYLKEGETSLDADRRAAVQKDLDDLVKRIGHLKIVVNVKGASVFVDGKRAGVTPLADVVDVNEGERSVSVETAERGTKQRVVRVAGGEEQTVNLDFPAPERSKTSASSSGRRDSGAVMPPPAQPSGLGAAFWVTGIGALVLGAGAGTTGFFALKAQDDYVQRLHQFGVTEQALDDSRNKTKMFALTTDILAGTALVCASVATIVLVTHDSGPEEVGLGVGPGSVALRGNF